MQYLFQFISVKMGCCLSSRQQDPILDINTNDYSDVLISPNNDYSDENRTYLNTNENRQYLNRDTI